MFRHFLRVFALATVIGFKTLSPSAHAQTITVVADEWPPFSGAELPNGGISLDVISTVLERAGYAVNMQVLPWARIMDGSRKGEYDIVGSLFFDSEIAEYMTYGDPFYSTEVHFARQAGAGHTVDGLESLQPYSIAVGDGFLYEERFDRAEDLNKVVVTTALQGLQMVAHGRADLTLDSVEVLQHAIRKDDPSIADRIEIMPFVLATHDIHMAVRNSLPGKDKLVEDFNRVLSEMQEDGSLQKLLRKHSDG
ncbi:MAG: transporter substrate-binding domain-containing protein [Pseudomonadota bacterium]